MPASLTSIAPSRGAGAADVEPRRRRFRDNPRLILVGIVGLLGLLVTLLALANGTSRFSPDFVSEFVLYALSAADLVGAIVLGIAGGLVARGFAALLRRAKDVATSVTAPAE